MGGGEGVASDTARGRSVKGAEIGHGSPLQNCERGADGRNAKRDPTKSGTRGDRPDADYMRAAGMALLN